MYVNYFSIKLVEDKRGRKSKEEGREKRREKEEREGDREGGRERKERSQSLTYLIS